MASTAHGAELMGTLSESDGSYYETFDIESNAGISLTGYRDFIQFPISNDSSGNDAVDFGDESYQLGLLIVTANTPPGTLGGLRFYDYLDTSPYDDAYPDEFTLKPGVFTDAVSCPAEFNYCSGVLTLTLAYAPTPEPGAWTLMLVGVGAVGATVRRARGRRRLAAA